MVSKKLAPQTIRSGFANLRHFLYYFGIKTGEQDIKFRIKIPKKIKEEKHQLTRQEYEKTYDPNGYVDVYRSHFVIGNGKLLGDRVLAYITPKISEVDTLEEFEFLEYQAQKNPVLVSRFLKKKI